MLKKIFIPLLVMLTCSWQAGAQQSSKEAVIRELKKVSDFYYSIPHLSFDMKYYCSNESTPAIYIDSLNGQIKASGKNYWYSLDSTESITTGGYSIILFKEDKLMYLKKADSARGQLGNPMAMMDSIILNNEDITCTMQEGKQEKIITFQFTRAAAYKRIEYHLNTKTGFIDRIVSLINAAELYDPSVKDLLDKTEAYAYVDIYYKNYSRREFDESIFDASHYFKVEDREYIPSAQYESYTIFLGSTNL